MYTKVQAIKDHHPHEMAKYSECLETSVTQEVLETQYLLLSSKKLRCGRCYILQFPGQEITISIRPSVRYDDSWPLRIVSIMYLDGVYQNLLNFPFYLKIFSCPYWITKRIRSLCLFRIYLIRQGFQTKSIFHLGF